MNLYDTSGKLVVGCDFCGTVDPFAEHIVTEGSVAICDKCIDIAAQTVEEMRTTPNTEATNG